MGNTKYAKYLDVWTWVCLAYHSNFLLRRLKMSKMVTVQQVKCHPQVEMSFLKRVFISSYLHPEKCYTDVLLLLAVVKYTD